MLDRHFACLVVHNTVRCRLVFGYLTHMLRLREYAYLTETMGAPKKGVTGKTMIKRRPVGR